MSGPELSVIVVAYGDGDEVAACLARVRAATGPAHEIIVVDNPRDGDPVGDLPDADLVVRNQRNVGFGPAVEQGVLLSGADRLALLNPDVVVPVGWAEPLLAALDADPAAVAAGPSLIDADGTVQEVGSVIGREAHTLAFGRPPADGSPHLTHTHAVDYCSAACLVVERAALVAVGGLDAVFAPGYFEDVDLALSWTRHGWRTLVVPSVEVVHRRQGSFGEAATGFMERNRPVVAGRWASELADRPPLEDHGRHPRRLLALRDLPRPQRLLVVVDGDPDGWTDLVLAAAEHHPEIAVTAAVPGDVGHARVEPLSPDAVDATWLRARLLHHTAVWLDPPAADRLGDLLPALVHPQTSDVGIESARRRLAGWRRRRPPEIRS